MSEKSQYDDQFHTVRGYQLIDKDSHKLTPAMEDYLEMIYRKIDEHGFLRCHELAEFLNVQAPSATKMIQKLAGFGYLKYERYGVIQPTVKGYEIGKFLLKRHKIIETFLKYIGVLEHSLKETELIEHNISELTLEKINVLNIFFEEHPEIFISFLEYRKHEK